jgi:exodeoxyribonuclease VII large subunit
MGQQIALDWGPPPRRQFSVSELTGIIAGLLADTFDDVWVAGEISGVKLASSGHYYFSLKDEGAQIRCACFKSNARFLKFKPQDGMAVLARGRVDVFPPRGEYQLIVEVLEPQGHGALQLAFEQLKRKLAVEGLFEAARKRPLPRLPRRIGIVTSPSGAVIHDMLLILERRFPGLHIRLYPALVQGEGSVDAVCQGINYFSRSGWAEVVIVARGGGSLEDLWTFNEEAVARAIASCTVPVISAVGHETDFTIADFVADLRAPTPSAAAELVICTRDQLLEQVDALAARGLQAARYRLAMARQRLDQQGFARVTGLLHRNLGRRMQRVDEFDYRVREAMRARLDGARRALEAREQTLRRLDLRVRLAEAGRRLEQNCTEMSHAVRLGLQRAHRRLGPLEATLGQLSPLKILDRGYAIVQDPDGHVVKEWTEAPAGSDVRIRLANGRLRALVTAAERDPAPE